MKRSIIPLFIPHYGCPHQCIFCDQVRITGASTPVTAADVSRIIDMYLSGAPEGRYWEAAFYGGSFTAIPHDVMEKLLAPAAEALSAGRIRAIRLSTRPDCIDEAVLEILKTYGVSTVELGVQSLDEAVLQKAERGHTGEDAARAVSLLREHGFAVGLQFLIGLPGEDFASLRRTARLAARLRPDFLRLYPLLVLQGTKLARMYAAGEYRPLSVSEAAFRCAFLKRWYEARGIRIIRMGLQATDELTAGGSLLAGPYHPSMGELADQIIVRHELLRAAARLGGSGALTLRCHPRDRSKVMGLRRKTWRALAARFADPVCCEEAKDLPLGTAELLRGAEQKYITLYRIFPEER